MSAALTQHFVLDGQGHGSGNAPVAVVARCRARRCCTRDDYVVAVVVAVVYAIQTLGMGQRSGAAAADALHCKVACW